MGVGDMNCLFLGTHLHHLFFPICNSRPNKTWFLFFLCKLVSKLWVYFCFYYVLHINICKSLVEVKLMRIPPHIFIQTTSVVNLFY